MNRLRRKELDAKFPGLIESILKASSSDPVGDCHSGFMSVPQPSVAGALKVFPFIRLTSSS
jgi:hypothetical protein